MVSKVYPGKRKRISVLDITALPGDADTRSFCVDSIHTHLGGGRNPGEEIKGGNKMSKKKKRHTSSEIASKLGEAATLGAQGHTQREIAQALDISVMTFHRWRRAQPQALQPRSSNEPAARPIVPITNLSGSARRGHIAELQLENTQLRRLVTDLLLEKMRTEEEAGRNRGNAIMKNSNGTGR
jgi:putative transposase